MTGKDVLRAVGEIDEADIELVKRYGRRRWLKAFAAAAAAMILLGAAFAAGLAAGRGRGEAGQSVSSPSAAPSEGPWETKSEGAFYGVNELKEKWAPPSSEGDTLTEALKNAVADPENSGRTFAVELSFETGEDGELQNELDRLLTTGPIARRNERKAKYEIALGIGRTQRVYASYGPEGFEVVFDAYWRGEVSESVQQLYDEAVRRSEELREKLLGEAYRAEAEYLSSLGCEVHYEYGAHIKGLLTAEQLLSLSELSHREYTVKWLLDPSLTAEAILASVSD